MKKAILLIATIIAVNFLPASLLAQDIEIADGGIFTLSAGSYSNTISSTTQNNASTAIAVIGNAAPATVTLDGDHDSYYGSFTMYNGSTLKYASISAVVPAKVIIGAGTATATTTFVKQNGAFTLSGDLSSNTFQIGNYGVLDLSDASNSGDLTLAKDLYFTSNTDANSYIKYKLSTTYKIISTAGKIYTDGTDGVIDVSKKFVFDMTDVTAGTAGETRNFTIATCKTLPVVTGTPTASNAVHWTDFAVTVTGGSGTGPTPEYNIIFSATYKPILYVDASKTDDSGDGLSWANAKKTLQAALDLSLAGYQIWVKEGTYYPTLERGNTGQSDERFKTFQMKDGVAIYGGFDLTTPEATFADRAIKDNPTILSGDLDVNDLYSGTGSTLSISNNSGNCYSVVRNDVVVAAVGPTAILDGFIIKGGNADNNATNLTFGGGGMHNNATNPTIRNCRFEYNSGIHGGAFFSWNSTSAFYNCVFVNNYGYGSGYGGTIYNNGGNGLAFNNCTIANNYSANRGGVISYGISTILNNSIVWGNYSVNSGHQIYCTASGNITLNYSCYQNEAGDVFAEIGSTFTATNNDITTDPKFVDAAIGVFSIAGTSSCLDLGNDTYNTLTTDIRGAGFGRKLLKTDPLTVGTIDIGAYEYKYDTDPASNCEDAITVLNTNDAGAGSLRQAMLDICEDGIITFNESLGTQTITLTSGELPMIDLGVTIDASTLTSTITIDANNTSRIFNINCAAPAIVNIKNLTLINASTVGDGGGIYVASGNIALSLLDVDITGCDAANGGAIYQTGGTLGVNSCGVTSNTATTYGGAVYVAAGTFTSTFSQYNLNTALYGGGLYVNSGTIALTNDSLLTNSASLTGGGFYLKEGSLTLSNSKVNRNTAATFGAGGYEELGSAFLLATTSEIMGNICTSGAGAGLFVGVGFAEISQSTINGNRAEGATDWGDGGAIYVTDGNLTLVSNIIKYNYAYRWGGALVLNGMAVRNGTPATIHSTNDTISCNSTETGVAGAIYLYQGNSDFTGTKIEWNESSNYGGGVCVWDNTGTTTFDQCTFSNNRTRNNASDVLNYGGAMFIDNAVVGVTSSTFTSNYCSNTRSSATPKGGAVYVYDGTFNATNSIFTSNVVTNTGSKGGAVFNDMADVNIASCTFTTNAAGRNGGAIFTNQLTANTSSTNSTFTSNSAGKLGGALYLENGTMTSNNCDFSLNIATGLAGAAGGAINHNLGTSTTTNCEIFSNTADVAGGFYLKNGTANIVNSLFYGNSASTYGGALYVELSTAVLNITNTTIASNSTNEVLTMGGGITSGGGGIANQASTGITLHNTLLWNNITFGDGAQIANIGSTPIVLDYCSYSNYTNDVYGTLTVTNSNTTFPNFVDPSADDYRLGGNSSSADAGLNSYCSESYDIRGIGFSRFRNKNPGTPPSATIDLGAYEYQLTVDPLLGCTNPTNGGQITSDQSGCVSFDPAVLTNVTLPSGENGTLEYKWQQSTTSAAAGFVDIASSTFSTYDPGTVSVNTWFRRLARVSCMDTWLGAIASNAVEMLIYPTSVGGTISGTSPITYGESTGTLTLSGFTGDVLTWQHKYGTAEFADISGTATSTFTETPVSAGTWTYRAEVQSGVCSSTWSDEFVLTVDKKTLTTSGAVADTKIYDGNTDATITGPVLIGIVSFGGTEDDVNLVQPYTGTFTTEIVGTHSVTASLSLAGTDKDNYSLTQPAGLSAEITAKELTVTGATADDKVYDGNTAAVISGASLDGIVGLDDVDLDALTGTFASEVFGTHSVTATLTLKGTDKDNYSLTQPTGLSANITAKELTVIGTTADDKVYDGNTDAVISGASLVGIVGSDDVDLDALTGTFDTEIVGTHSVTATLTLKGTDKDNYSLTQPTGLSADITAKELTVSGATADDKIYDGNTDAVISGSSLVGIAGVDDVDLDALTGTFESEVVGTHTVTATLTLKGTDKDNYTLTQPAGLSAEITAKELTVTGATADNKVYDGNTNAVISGASLVGIVGVDDVDLDALTGTFASEVFGTHTVTATMTLKGTDKDNYSLTQPTGLSADITAKELTVSGATADDKVYDGNTDAVISGASLVGIVGSDDVDLDALTGTFASEIVGTHSVTSTLTLKGTDKDNYSLAQPTGLSADITAKELTVSGATADDKIYDGNTDAEISGSSLVGIVDGDDVTLDDLTGIFASEVVGTHSVTATLTITGDDIDNYSLTQPTGLSAEITAKELTVSGATADDKVYDGNTDAVISGASLDGIVDGDNVTLDDLTGIFASHLVGTHSVTATLTITGTDADNYTLTQPTGLSAEIYPGVPASFTLTGPSSVTAGNDSDDFTIQVYDAFGNPTYCDEETCFSLTTTSNGQGADFSNDSPCIALDEGSTTFTYTDSKTGSFTITASFQSGSVLLTGQSESVTIIVDILPWIHANIGASNGTTEFFPEINSGTFQMTAKGLSTPYSDVMNFVYQQLCGTGTVIAHLDDSQNGGWAGVMMRESNAPGSKAVLFKTKLYNPSVIIGYRATTNAKMVNLSQMIPSIHWMKIQRSGNTFKIFTSYNGTNWDRRYTATVVMPNCIEAGIFTESIQANRTVTSWFDHAEVVGYLKSDEEGYFMSDSRDAFEIEFYPNPTLDQITIMAPENDRTIKVTLINASGSFVETVEFNTMDAIYNLQHIKPGVYLLRFERDGLVVNKRLIVM